MKTHTVPIITNGPLCGEACPWLAVDFPHGTTAVCLLFRDAVRAARSRNVPPGFYRRDSCRHVTERAEALP